MSNAALVTLTNNILANTLTTLEKACLAQALELISPTFPTPDEIANGIPQPEEDLARQWMAALYAISAGETPPVPPGTVPARAYAVSGALTLNAGIQTAADVTLTPIVSGRLKVRISGVIENSDSSATQHPITVTVNAGAGTLASQVVFHGTSSGAGAGTTPFSFVVDLDKTAAPTVPAGLVAPLGVPMTINAALQGDASGDLSVLAGGLQLEVEEAFG